MSMTLTYEHCACNLEDGRKYASLRERQHLGTNAGTERVGHVVGANAESQYERHHKPAYHNP